MHPIASFDIFDTVLTRAVGSPEAVYLLLGRCLRHHSLIGCTAEAFAAARSAAELRTYKNIGVENTTLEDIYTELSVSLWLQKDLCARMIEMECELEAALLRPVPQTRHLIDEARARGQRIVFVSDTYFTEAFITSQLTRHGILQPGDRCYVSSSYRKMKSSGALFRELLREETVQGEDVSHHGNHPDYDVRSAQAAGLRASAFDEGNLNRYEQILEAFSSQTDGLSSVLAGASRLARLSLPVATERERSLRDVAAGVAAPAVVGFLLWMLQRAKGRGLKRLYFVSREGQILLQVARRLAPKLGVDCELRYLYGSRQAWNVAGIKGDDDIDGSWLWDDTDFLSVESLLSRLCIRPDEVKAALDACGLDERSWSRNLDQDQRFVLRGVLRRREIKTIIMQRAVEQRAVLAKYLRQEGLLDPVDWALVDVGWRGSLQASLASTLREFDDKPLAGFYFGLDHRPGDERCGTCETYFYDVDLRTGFLPSKGSRWILLLEMFCAADHGTVLGFVEDNGCVTPRLKQQRNEAVARWGLEIIQKTVCCFAETLLLDSGLVDPRADVRPAIKKLGDSFWLNPTRSEALAWGDFPWEDGFGAHSYTRTLAERYDWGNVARALYWGSPAAPRRPSWRAGSVAAMTTYTRRALRVALFLGRLNRRMKAPKPDER